MNRLLFKTDYNVYELGIVGYSKLNSS